ncbi:hypothetical protein ACFQ34_27460 [Pseudonocardia benzenivorans]|uniref:Uncharacterized protein n=2 Tax=Pseudonocardia TaxID=1847 RepID=F4CT29_PSEUX|nr:hypothetical protein [Pseudonocardia dioxanivorans]AEA25328.1 hypothetical protein Psed_3131 [Pseudonocardia dioxanivorans CB1190]GJF02292.1 hypothetical protein PSD17_12560 [Pseudonocardia sp. D17]
MQERERPGPGRAAATVALGALVAALAAGWVSTADPAIANRGWDAGHTWESSQLT